MTNEEIKTVLLSKTKTPLSPNMLDGLVKTAKMRMKLENITLEEVMRTTYTISQDPAIKVK